MASPIAVRDLEGKVALVTGATSGIGKAAAIQLAAQGATVIVHGRDADRGAAVVAEIENGGGSARFVSADLGEPAQALRLAEEAGDVDILVNNAGFAWFGPSAKLDAKTLDQLFAPTCKPPTCWCRSWPRKRWPAATASSSTSPAGPAPSVSP